LVYSVINYVVYLFLLFLSLRIVFGVLLFVLGGLGPHNYAWTIINVLHSVVTFYIIHWQKGQPFWRPAEDAGRYDRLTFWEQIDQGKQYTKTKKIFQMYPLILFLLAEYDISWDPVVTFINLAFGLLAVIPKFAGLHGVRIAGINRD